MIINKGEKVAIYFEFQGQCAIVSNADEAIEAISKFHLPGWSPNHPEANLFNIKPLAPGKEKSLRVYFWELFNGQPIITNYVTKRSGYALRVNEALADTPEEHKRLYRVACEQYRQQREKQDRQTDERLSIFTQHRRGWYRVSYEVCVSTWRDVTSYQSLDYSVDIIADSMMDAYEQSERLCQAECERKGYLYQYRSSWHDTRTDATFLGMKVDGGYSLTAWDEFHNENNNKVVQ